MHVDKYSLLGFLGLTLSGVLTELSERIELGALEQSILSNLHVLWAAATFLHCFLLRRLCFLISNLASWLLITISSFALAAGAAALPPAPPPGAAASMTAPLHRQPRLQLKARISFKSSTGLVPSHGSE